MSADNQVESPDHSLSIAEAAAHLGVAPATIRRRIKTGELGAFKRTTAYGFEWRILLEQTSEAQITSPDQHVITPTQQPDHVVESADHAPGPEMLKALEVIDRLQQQNQELWKTLEHWQARAVEAEQTVKLLMAPKDEPDEPEPPAEPVRVSWWKRLWGG